MHHVFNVCHSNCINSAPGRWAVLRTPTLRGRSWSSASLLTMTTGELTTRLELFIVLVLVENYPERTYCNFCLACPCFPMKIIFSLTNCRLITIFFCADGWTSARSGTGWRRTRCSTPERCGPPTTSSPSSGSRWSSINTTQELETKLHGLKFYNHGYTRPLLKIPSSSLSVLNGS